jgi:hypothetical protein
MKHRPSLAPPRTANKALALLLIGCSFLSTWSAAPFFWISAQEQHEARQGSTCTTSKRSLSSADHTLLEQDPALKLMKYSLNGDEEESERTFWAYVEPDISTFYRAPEGSREKVDPAHNGLLGKFINLSNQSLSLYW